MGCYQELRHALRNVHRERIQLWSDPLLWTQCMFSLCCFPDPWSSDDSSDDWMESGFLACTRKAIPGFSMLRSKSSTHLLRLPPLRIPCRVNDITFLVSVVWSLCDHPWASLLLQFSTVYVDTEPAGPRSFLSLLFYDSLYIMRVTFLLLLLDI